MGIGRVWTARCRSCSGNATSGIKNNHAAGRNNLGRKDYSQLCCDSRFLSPEIVYLTHFVNRRQLGT